jgi:hypothetical protein
LEHIDFYRGKIFVLRGHAGLDYVVFFLLAELTRDGFGGTFSLIREIPAFPPEIGLFTDFKRFAGFKKTSPGCQGFVYKFYCFAPVLWGY